MQALIKMYSKGGAGITDAKTEILKAWFTAGLVASRIRILTALL
jgi:hypothetical protein